MGGVHSRRHPKQDSQIQYETVLLNQQVVSAEIMRLEALVEDQGERIRRFMKNDHRAFPDEHSNPMFVDAKMMNS
jgi:hypothetical protein